MRESDVVKPAICADGRGVRRLQDLRRECSRWTLKSGDEVVPCQERATRCGEDRMFSDRLKRIIVSMEDAREVAQRKSAS